MYSVLMKPADDAQIVRFRNMTALDACLLPNCQKARFVIVGNHPMRHRVVTRGELVIHLLMTPDDDSGIPTAKPT
ncbi:MAG: hypothetical protein V4747_06915 [Pseudomonadota bacterium]